VLQESVRLRALVAAAVLAKDKRQSSAGDEATRAQGDTNIAPALGRQR
jgi:hypothetical protein